MLPGFGLVFGEKKKIPELSREISALTCSRLRDLHWWEQTSPECQPRLDLRLTAAERWSGCLFYETIANDIKQTGPLPTWLFICDKLREALTDWKRRLRSASFWGSRGILCEVTANGSEWSLIQSPEREGRRPRSITVKWLAFIFILRN